MPLRLSAAVMVAGFIVGCGGGDGGPRAFSPILTPTVSPTATPRPQQNSFVGNYSGSYTATFHPASPISGTRSGPLNFTVRADGTVLFTTGATSGSGNPVAGSGRCDLRTGRITWNSGLTSGFGIRSFSGQLTIGANGVVTGRGTVDYVEQSELATGPWRAENLPVRR